MRVLNANLGVVQHGVFTKNPELPTNDFLVNLLDRERGGRRFPNRRTFLRGATQIRSTQVDRNACRPGVWFEFPTPGIGGSLWKSGFPAEIPAERR
jgi:catalase (peroxidase I)